MDQEPVPTPTKSIFASKVFWANVIALGVPILAAKGINLSPEYQEKLIEVLVGVIPLVNIGLRFVTTGPVQIIPPKPPAQPALTQADMEIITETIKTLEARINELEVKQTLAKMASPHFVSEEEEWKSPTVGTTVLKTI